MEIMTLASLQPTYVRFPGQYIIKECYERIIKYSFLNRPI